MPDPRGARVGVATACRAEMSPSVAFGVDAG